MLEIVQYPQNYNFISVAPKAREANERLHTCRTTPAKWSCQTCGDNRYAKTHTHCLTTTSSVLYCVVLLCCCGTQSLASHLTINYSLTLLFGLAGLKHSSFWLWGCFVYMYA